MADNKQNWRKRLGGLDFNPAYKKYVIELVEKELQEQREETIEIIKMESSNYTGYITQMSSLKSFDTGNIIRKFKDTLLKQLKK